ncbi:hypothetical protein VMCG_01804 [Cytospora schulzeri]|uniref:C2H2-type domain-containing protein n=1 Tax=Cytospora schulzeri TaxID=448051 RepID=A0A423X3J0_9PEZI|nr:hypothetical protein VMCG_01804 [Valsa malicola]
MLLRPLFAAAGLSAVTQALLLPPEINSHDVEILESIPFESVAVAQTQTVNLDCPGCPPVFNKHDGKSKHQNEHSSHLELDFSIDRAAGGDRLMLNGFELYPHSDPFTNALVAPQVAEKPKQEKDHKDHKDHKEHGKNVGDLIEDEIKALLSHHKFRPGGEKSVVEQQLGFSLQIHPENTADEGLDLIVVDLQIIEVGSVFVDGLANMRVHLIKTPDNDLLIGKIEQTASETVSTPMEDDKECTNMLCKWKAMVAEQLNKMKMHGCGGKMGAKAEPVHAQPHHPTGHNGLFDKPNGWTLLFRKLTSHIILPVLVGIAAGVSVSIIGMIVGTLMVGVWRKFVRGQTFFPQHRRRSHSGASHKAARMEAAAAEEKAGLMQEDVSELPPTYEDETNNVEQRAVA